MRRRGQALILVLLLLSVTAGAVLFSFFNSAKVLLDSDQKTADALALAKTALIGRAVSDNNRPGSLRCPDVDDDGLLTMGVDYFTGGICASNMGRLPWRTLGLPDLRDAGGEHLWYAVSPNFRDITGNIINSDTRGNITVFAADGTTTLTTRAVAVIFAPGQALGAQSRSASITAACVTTGTTIAQNLCAANYLETSAGINNATTNGPFITGLRSATYNDRVITITTPEIIPIVEQRVARELQTAIQIYYNTNGYFPFAAAFDDTSGNCASNLRRGRVPITAGDCTGMTTWNASLPAWFVANKWWQVMYYSVAPGYVNSGGNSCTGGCLTLGANTSVPALFFTPGTPGNNAWRTATLDTTLSHYLEDPANQDGWGAGGDDTYVTPTSALFDRDRVFILAGGASNPQCANNAAALLALTPCGQPPKLNPQCTVYSDNLAGCGCYSASTVMINPPCQNTLKPPECQAAVVTLKACDS